ncbi:hypothetical protein EZV62_007783 [Acer yangbiense]|uniref:Uncharacterized protein n=1 Tax=Acer yangbiense TaxID=1000413 RepID=A0A5C7IBH2_9ROSI|nr:hypothetical protein EZV62_007783 [Acer yangbiense]
MEKTTSQFHRINPSWIDGAVVIGALILEGFIERKGGGLLVVVSLWRVVRVVESAFELSDEAIEAQIQGLIWQLEALREDNVKLRGIIAEKDEIIEKLQQDLDRYKHHCPDSLQCVNKYPIKVIKSCDWNPLMDDDLMFNVDGSAKGNPAAVSWVNGEDFGKLRLVYIVYDIRLFLLNLKGLSVSFRPRGSNSVVDSLAKLGSSRLGDRLEWGDF